MESIYGHHAVTSVIEAGNREIKELYLADKHQGRYKSFADKLENTQIFSISMKELDKKFPNQVHQGVVAMVSSLQSLHLEDIINDASRLLILDQVTDPHNLGACLRNANAFGCDAVLIPEHNSVKVTEIVAKASAGAIEYTPIIVVGNINKAIKLIQQANFWVVGLDGYADKTLSEIDLKGKVAICMGSEGSGMRDLVKKNCDFLAKIPMTGEVESLNVSVSAGIALYELSRQN